MWLSKTTINQEERAKIDFSKQFKEQQEAKQVHGKITKRSVKLIVYFKVSIQLHPILAHLGLLE